MSSKLFRAVVGLGISFGTASVACLGAVDLGPDERAPGPITPPTHTPVEKAPPGRPRPPAVDDAGPAVEASNDVGIDAFCDASWPTTKGSPVPTCGPIEACADAGPRPHCFALGATGECLSGDGKLQPVRCVAGGWQCETGFVRAADCRCFEGDPCN